MVVDAVPSSAEVQPATSAVPPAAAPPTMNLLRYRGQPGRVIDRSLKGRDNGRVRIEVGPVAQRSAEAWLGYAESVVESLRGNPAGRAPEEVLDAFVELIGIWRSVEPEGDRFHWVGERPPDEVEYMINALYEAGLAVEQAHAEGLAELRPAEADEFHYALVNQVLAALEAEGGSETQLAEILRQHWDVASD